MGRATTIFRKRLAAILNEETELPSMNGATFKVFQIFFTPAIIFDCKFLDYVYFANDSTAKIEVSMARVIYSHELS